MSIVNITPRESELQKQVIELAESLRNLGWEFELYKQGARATHQKLLDEIRELKADNENLRAYAKHERSLGAEAFAMENLDLTQQVEILKAKLADAPRIFSTPVGYQYKYGDYWRFSNGEQINGSYPIKARSVYVMEDEA